MPSERSRSVRRISTRSKNENQTERPCCAQVNRCWGRTDRNPTHRRRPENAAKASECRNRWKCEGAASRHTRRSLPSNLRRGTAHLRGTTDSWCRENFSCREDELSPPHAGAITCVSTESPEPARAGKVVQHMAPVVPTGSQRRLPSPPTHLLLSGAKQTRSPMLAALPVEHAGAKPRSRSEKRHFACIGANASTVLGIPACFTLAV